MYKHARYCWIPYFHPKNCPFKSKIFGLFWNYIFCYSGCVSGQVQCGSLLLTPLRWLPMKRRKQEYVGLRYSSSLNKIASHEWSGGWRCDRKYSVFLVLISYQLQKSDCKGTLMRASVEPIPKVGTQRTSVKEKLVAWVNGRETDFVFIDLVH